MRSISPLRSLVLLLLVVATLAAPVGASLGAQLRGGGQQARRSTGTPSWWLSGGAGVIGLGEVHDGASSSQWDFSGDPRWLVQGTLEKTMQPTTTLGIAVRYGTVDLGYSRLAGAPVLDLPPTGELTSVQTCVFLGCTATVEAWGVQGIVRGGGGNDGLYQVVEVSGGVNGFRNMKAKSDGALLPVKNAVDLNGSIGYGIGFALSSSFHVAFVQDFGIAWHSGDGLPDGVKRTYNTRNSRVTVRYGIGSYRR